MPPDDRATREEKVIEQVRQWLAELTVGESIEVVCCDPAENGGAQFSLAKRGPAPMFACRRRGDR